MGSNAQSKKIVDESLTKNKGAAGRGRPKGSLSKKTLALKQLAADAFNGGVMPLEVMLDNMRYYHGQAQETLIRIVAGIGKDDATELLEEFKLNLSYRMKAQECAVDVAPYLHSKLSNVTVKGDEENPLTIQERDAAFKTIEGTLAQVIAATASSDAGESELDGHRASKPVDSAGEKPENGEAVVQMVNARWSRLRKNASRG